MNLPNLLAHTLVGLIALVCCATQVFADFGDLVKKIPQSANGIVLINVENIFESEIGKKNNWRSNHEKAFASGVSFIPSDGGKYILATQVDYEFMHPIWEVALLQKATGTISLGNVAKQYRGHLDNVAGKDAVVLPGDALLVKFDDTTAGGMSPANRQAVARWVRDSDAATSSRLSPYLQEAVAFADKAGTEIIIAFDLEYAVPGDAIREKLKTSKYLKNKIEKVEPIAKCLDGIRGITLGVTVRDGLYGKIKVDFKNDSEVLTGFGKAIMLEALARNGLMIDDFAKWKSDVDGRQYTIAGPLSESAMRQIGALIQPPIMKQLSGGGGSTSTKQDDPAQATLKYFKSMLALQKEVKDKKPTTIYQYGQWFAKYANLMDQLSVINVDEQMLEYGDYVSKQYRSAGSAVRQMGINIGVRNKQNPDRGASWGGGVDYTALRYNGIYRTAGSYYEDNSAARRAARADERAKGSGTARSILQNVDEATGVIRKAMSQKYQIDF